MLRSATLHVRMTEEEYTAAVAKAAAAGVTLSEFVRTRTLSDNGRPIIRTDSATLKSIYSTLRKCGGLLNQACHALNRGQRSPLIEKELGRATHSVAKAADEVSRFIHDARDSI